MKLIFSGNTAWSMYNFRKDILSECIKNGHKVFVIAPSDPYYEKLIKELGCTFIPINIKRKGTNPIQDLKLYFQYRKHIKKIKPNGCFFYTIKPNIYGGLAASHLNIPYIPVTTVLGYVFNTKSIINNIVQILYKLSFKRAKQVWFLNNDDASLFVDKAIIARNKVKILKGEGIDINKFQVVSADINPNNELVFLLFARMLWDKGVGIFVEAAKKIKQSNPTIRFQLLGTVDNDNPMGISMTQLMEWNNNGYIEYLGNTNDVRPYIYKSSCVVLPSYYREGIPFCLMEGAAAGKPLITTDNIGCKEVVEDGYNGFLCSTNDVSSLVEALNKMINLSPESRIKMGQNGRKKIENEFNIELIKNEYTQTINLLFK